MYSPITISIQKTDFLTCDNWVIELPLFSLKTHTVSRWKANSLYVLELDSGLDYKQVEFNLDTLEKINKYWNVCIVNDLDCIYLE